MRMSGAGRGEGWGMVALLTKAIVVLAVTIGLGVGCVTGMPITRAYADDAVSDTDSSAGSVRLDNQEVASSDAIPENPGTTLPDQVSESIPDDATVVSEDLAVTNDGEVKDIETGEPVTDPAIVGTQDAPADPLAKTDGKSFIPVDASEVKDAVSANGGDAYAVTPASFTGNEYGAHWGTYNGTPAFFDYQNNLFAQQAKGVIDVSEWQGDIDWTAAKADGVQGAIIRIGFGAGNRIDAKAQRNINECKRLGIPFGVYLYSYTEVADSGDWEGDDLVAKLSQLGVSPGDLTYPVFYDLEDWTGSWTGHRAPTDPNVWNGAVNKWYAKLQAAGYNNLGVYSYTSYLNTSLNTANIRSKVRWIASYGSRTGFDIASNDRGWQYTANGRINGVNGTADLNAFGVKTVSNSNNPDGTSTNTASFPVKGDMGAEWRRIGGSNSVIGNPVANEVCDWTPVKTNCYQNFQYGAISWTPSTGAHYTAGELRREWENRSFEHGVLGYPTADEERLSDGWWRQSFQNGDIWVNGTDTKLIMLFNLRDAYNAHGGYERLGAPVANEERLSGSVSGYWRQRCVRGDVWTNGGSAQKYVMLLNLRDSYNAHGGFARLGGPTADEERLSGSVSGYWRQRCVRGDVWTNGGSAQKYVMLLALRDEYYRRGGFSKIGGPTSDEWHDVMWYQRCQKQMLQVW